MAEDCRLLECPTEDDYSVYNLQDGAAEADTSVASDCRLLECELEDDYGVYNLQDGAAPQSTLPVSECRLQECPIEDDYGVFNLQDLPVPIIQIAFNDAVTYCCPTGETLTFTGSLPGWITLNSETNCLVGSAGTFQAATKSQANAIAQTAMDDFSANAGGDLDCSSTPVIDVCTEGVESILGNVYQIQGYFDGMIDGNGAASALPAWDGTFKSSRLTQNSWYSGNRLTNSMDGLLLCIARMAFEGCIDDIPQWRIEVEGGFPALAWSGVKTGGNTPMGVYTSTGFGLSAGPATLIIELGAGSTIPLVGPGGCEF